MNRNHIIAAVAAILPAILNGQNSFDIALLGDMPYGPALNAAYERLISEVNFYNPSLVAFIGDTKSGSTRCDDSHYTQALQWFNTFEGSVIYSVGDNEWTDCMRENNGSFDPLGRLSIIRRMLFPTNLSLGRRPIPLQRQSDDAGFDLYRENAILVRGRTVFVSLHVPGSNNNFEYRNVTATTPNPFYDNNREYAARNAANLAWLAKAFQAARDNDAYGVMILVQANVFETFFESSTGSERSGHSDFIAALRRETQNYIGQVVLVHGDSHYGRIDKPLTTAYPACGQPTGACNPVAAAAAGTRIMNFTRVEVPGSADVHWLRCRVRPNRRSPFLFEYMVVDSNK